MSCLSGSFLVYILITLYYFWRCVFHRLKIFALNCFCLRYQFIVAQNRFLSRRSFYTSPVPPTRFLGPIMNESKRSKGDYAIQYKHYDFRRYSLRRAVSAVMRAILARARRARKVGTRHEELSWRLVFHSCNTACTNKDDLYSWSFGTSLGKDQSHICPGTPYTRWTESHCVSS